MLLYTFVSRQLSWDLLHNFKGRGIVRTLRGGDIGRYKVQGVYYDQRHLNAGYAMWRDVMVPGLC